MPIDGFTPMGYGVVMGNRIPIHRLITMTNASTPTTAFATAMQAITRHHLLLQYRFALLAGSAWGLVAITGARVQAQGIRGLDHACMDLDQLEQDLQWTGHDAAKLPGRPEQPVLEPPL